MFFFRCGFVNNFFDVLVWFWWFILRVRFVVFLKIISFFYSLRIFLDFMDYFIDNSSGGVICIEIIYNGWLNIGFFLRIYKVCDF